MFALTGLKIKAQSPLATTFTVELANGAEGYIPPAEQHALGGYTTWPARTAGLEVGAEAKITDAVLELLETVAGKKRRPLPDPASDGVREARSSRASRSGTGGWASSAGPRAADLAGRSAGTFEPGVVFGLHGPLPVAVRRAGTP